MDFSQEIKITRLSIYVGEVNGVQSNKDYLREMGLSCDLFHTGCLIAVNSEQQPEAEA